MNIEGYGKYLFLFRDFEIPIENTAPFKLSNIELTSDLKVDFDQTSTHGLSVKLLTEGGLNWRWREGGEKVKLPGRHHRSSLKKLLQQNKIPEWERRYLPYLEKMGEIVWVHGIGVTKNYIVPNDCTDQVIPRFTLGRGNNNSN